MSTEAFFRDDEVFATAEKGDLKAKFYRTRPEGAGDDAWEYCIDVYDQKKRIEAGWKCYADGSVDGSTIAETMSPEVERWAYEQFQREVLKELDIDLLAQD